MKISLLIKLDLLPAEADALKRLQAETPVNGITGQAPVYKNTGQAAADPSSFHFAATGLDNQQPPPYAQPSTLNPQPFGKVGTPART